jgi:hypothetical protein
MAAMETSWQWGGKRVKWLRWSLFPSYIAKGSGVMKSVIIGIVLCVAVGASAAENVKVPGQAAYGAVASWSLDVTYEQPRLFTSGGASYWYVILSLTNKTGKEVGFYPDCDLLTDTYQLIQAGSGVPEEVYGKIQELYKDRYPFLSPLQRSMGKLLVGEDQAKDVLVVWKDFDKDAHFVRLFIGGLSGQTTSVEKPAVDGQPAEQVMLRKTLEFDYAVSGDADMRGSESLLYKGMKWVMR